LGTKYWFDSFGNSGASQFLASGTVVTTGQEEGNYIEVEVLTNSSLNPEFIDKKYWIVSNAKKDGSEAYQLYSDEGSTGTGMYVKIYESAPTRTVSISVKSDDTGVSGASVTIGETTKTTGSAGGCSFTLTDGDYDVTVTATGYEDAEDEISVAYDETSFDISIEESAS
jgi:uncharacterized membrane protein